MNNKIGTWSECLKIIGAALKLTENQTPLEDILQNDIVADAIIELSGDSNMMALATIILSLNKFHNLDKVARRVFGTECKRMSWTFYLQDDHVSIPVEEIRGFNHRNQLLKKIGEFEPDDFDPRGFYLLELKSWSK